MPLTQIERGQIVALFAFDVGYEVRLEELDKLLPSAAPRPLPGRKGGAPSRDRAATTPRSLPLGEARPLVSDAGQIQATVFDFGCVSVAFRWAIPPGGVRVEDLPQISQRLFALDLESEARERVRRLLKEVSPAITRQELSPLVEDYYLFILESLREPLPAAELYERHRADLAQALRFESAPLSPEQQDEATALRISYYCNDLVLLDWNAALLCDPDYADTANVLERLNVELLEARYIDAQLDKSIGDYMGVVSARPQWYFPLRVPYKKVVQHLAELRVEASLLAERVDNSLKLVGDQYLARVYSTAARRLHMREREAIIERKLDVVASFYRMLIDRIRTAQNQTLELVIILLILFEILMTIFTRLFAE